MAQITVIYKDFNEMVEVAKELLKGINDSVNAPDVEEKGKVISAAIAQATQLTPQQMVGQAPVQQQTAPVQTTSVPTTVPTSVRTYSLDELASAAMTLMDKGMQAQLQDLLARFGVEALPMLSPDRYGDFATALRGMGAQI